MMRKYIRNKSIYKLYSLESRYNRLKHYLRMKYVSWKYSVLVHNINMAIYNIKFNLKYKILYTKVYYNLKSIFCGKSNVCIFIAIGCYLSLCACAAKKPSSINCIRNRANDSFSELDRHIDKYNKVSSGALGLPVLSDNTDTDKRIQERVIRFEEVGEGAASKFERAFDAEKRAEEDALNKALKKNGIDVQSVFQDYMLESNKKSYSFVSNYVLLWSNAIVDYKQVEAPVYENLKEGGIKCYVKIKGEIISKGQRDPSYEIKLDYKNKKLGLNQPLYYNGDNFNVSFWATKNSYVHLIVIDEDKNASLLYPNWYDKVNYVNAGEIFDFPSCTPDYTNISLKTYLPENKKETQEFLHIIITKDKPLFDVMDVDEVEICGCSQLYLGDASKIFKRLAELERSQWAMVILPYGIKERQQ
ncbi:MAG: DUF4384 domain-containing protein [Endomicrobiales bacterium]|nr:DUF4384 domain-containing protein [Endomicrobiales bacterium]